MRSVAGAVVVIALVSGATSAAAAPARKKAEAAPAATLPAPSVKLDVAPVSAKRWTLRVENIGQVPLRIVADARLLSFEITPPASASPASSKHAKAPKTVTCALPADMRPNDDRDRSLVVPPGKAYKDSFDPRLYCFSAKESLALVAGAEIVAHYGFPPKRSTKRGKRAGASADATPTPPFVVASARVDGEPGPAPAAPPSDVGPLGSISTAPWTLSDTAVAPTLPATPPVTRATTEVDAHLAVSMTPRVDAARAVDAAATVSLANEDTRAANVYFRPQTIGFEVSGPRASAIPVTCTPSGAGAIRELYTHLGAHGRTSTTVLIEPSCPDHTFDLPGLYEVRPLVDTRRVAGAPPNLPSFTGEVVGAPALVRIRRGSEAVASPPPMVE